MTSDQKIIKMKVGGVGAGEAVGQHGARVPDHGVQPGQLLSIQGAVWDRRRGSAAEISRRKPILKNRV